ncbi:MAG: hypothetical protein JW839_06865 [Candidatus Lokiarchaeota archaeon]|nr:hypothetical protein [Candidatus Lokiarchaeota archaeon]
MKRQLEGARGFVVANTRPSTRIFLVYMSSLLAAYIAVLPFKAMGTQAQVEYYILDGNYLFGTASFPMSTIVEIAAFGPAMAVVMSWCLQRTIADWSAAGLMPARKARALELLLAVSIATFNAGLLLNRLFNVVGAQAKAFYDATGHGYNNYVFAYFLDEIVGHHLIGAGLVSYFAVMALAIPRDSTLLARPDHALNKGEKLLVLVPSAVHGVIFSVENLEGQSMAFSLVSMGAIACVVILMTMARRNKLAISNRPFLLFIVVQLVVMLAFSAAWGAALGVKPYAPFFYQPSELP